MDRNSARFRVMVAALAVIVCPLASASVPEPVIAPSLDCRQASSRSIAELVCRDEDLAELDSKLAALLAEAQTKAMDESPPQLAASQRRWLRSRNDCWKSRKQRECVEKSYRLRIAELQARYRLLSGNGPISYSCNDKQASKFAVTFFPTEPPTLIAERGEKSSLMVVRPSASGARYQSRNESFWERLGEATIVWGRGSKPMRCKPGS